MQSCKCKKPQLFRASLILRTHEICPVSLEWSGRTGVRWYVTVLSTRRWHKPSKSGRNTLFKVNNLSPLPIAYHNIDWKKSFKAYVSVKPVLTNLHQCQLPLKKIIQFILKITCIYTYLHLFMHVVMYAYTEL